LAKECQIGRLVLSRAGRDKDNSFIIIDILDENYVYICDGNIHTLDKPKKKKIKHLIFTNIICEDIIDLKATGNNIKNSVIKRFIQSHQVNKEVWMPYVKRWCNWNARYCFRIST